MGNSNTKEEQCKVTGPLTKPKPPVEPFTREQMLEDLVYECDATTGKFKSSPLFRRIISREARGYELSRTSVIPDDDPIRPRAEALLSMTEVLHPPTPDQPTTPSTTVQKATTLESRALGCMYGMICGDALGARLEFTPVQYEEKMIDDMGTGPAGKFQLQPGQWTDDSSMAMCIADSLLCCGGEWKPYDCMHRFLAW